MRILFAGERPGYPQRMTGAAVSTYLLADSLAKTGASVHLLCRLADDADGAVADAALAPFGIERIPNPAAGMPATITAFQPDVAVLSSGATMAIAQPLIESGIPIVLYQRDLGFPLVKALRSTDALCGVFACSSFIADALKSELGQQAVVLANVFPPERYRVDPKGAWVTLVNPVAEKGVGLVLTLAARHRDLTFQFVEGWKQKPEQKAKLQRRAASLGNIHWQDPVEDMRIAYGRTRVLLVPTRWREAWGRVVTEAQISGIPVLASNHGGLPESVGQGGLLLPPDDADNWSAALSKVMTDQAIWAGLSAQAKLRVASDDLNPNRIVAEFITRLHDWAR